MPPCNPAVTATGDCQTLIHTVTLTKSPEACADDAREVSVLYAPGVEGPYQIVSRFSWAAWTGDTVLTFDLSGSVYTQAGCYAVTVTDTLGNTSEPDAGICVDYCPSLIMSNIFTPNDDAVNDILRPASYRDVVLREFVIYDRWGRPMHTETGGDISRLWDGIQDMTGKPAEAGVYYYYLRYEELGLNGNRSLELTGWVTLLR
jgi:gliding motility-associated-like protein